MRRKNILIVPVTLLVVASCHPSGPTAEIAGEKFCVPAENSVPDVSWIPDSPLYPDSGFAFDSCPARSGSAEEGCPFLPNMRGGTFSEKSPQDGWAFADWDPYSHYGRIMHDPASSVELFRDAMAIIPDPELSGWLVMKLEEPYDDVGDATPLYKELLAICKYSYDYRKDLDGRRFIECRRHAFRGEYKLTYRFEADEKAPLDIDKIDDHLFTVMRSWRCVSE